jgi:Holliday junction resolvasome RuvABC ATP-dependent DNA helicase subunit
MMLKSILLDGAVAAAKSHNHAAVEPRHVLFAAVRYFRSRLEVEPLLSRAKQALEPRGTAFEVPKVTAEAEALIAKLTGSPDAVATLLELFGAGPAASPGVGAGTRTQTATQQVAEQDAEIDRPASAPPETTAQVLAELDGLVGLASVKRQLATIAAVVQANQQRSRAGMPAVTSGLHLVFTGPPGTGKTTVARLVARLYASTGALPAAKFTEVGRSDLVAGYVGQTAIKTAEIITRTRPGVLFIDEAYSLTPSHGSDFGAEAIATLVKAMEDHRGELAVIAAGYGDEMAEFVGSNPGLKSRFKTYVAFPDYTPEELTRIFAGFAHAAAIALHDGVLPAAEAAFRRAVGKRDFGNARFARSLFEHAYARMAARAAADGSVTVDEVSAIIAADLEWQESGLDRGERRIGFDRE